MDAIVYGNIPGGGMSRSASLTLNLILSLLEVNGIAEEDKLKVAELAQAVENDFIGSPCGLLDQIMIIFAREGMGTRFDPKSRNVSYVPAGKATVDFRLVCMDTGTVRPGLEKSTYKIRRAECEEFVEILQRKGYDIEHLADIKDEQLYDEIQGQFGAKYPDYCDRLKYIFGAQKRFSLMLEAWQAGDIEKIGQIFREDGIGLRDDYKISGPELETMCEIARAVPGVLGERMLGGGDKGAAGAIVKADSVDELKKAVDENYPKRQPAYADKYAVHVCKSVDGVAVFEGLI
jgi:galactokinase